MTTPAGWYLDPDGSGGQRYFDGQSFKMRVTNVGSEPQTFFASFNTLSDGTTEFQADDEAWIYLGNTLADLNPGDSIDTSVVSTCRWAPTRSPSSWMTARFLTA